MSKKIECRLPEQLYNDLKTRCQEEGVTVTDAVISNISLWLYPVMTDKIECHDKPTVKGVSNLQEIKTPVIKTPEQIHTVIPTIRPVYDRSFFNPQPKAVKQPKTTKHVPAATRPATDVCSTPTQEPVVQDAGLSVRKAYQLTHPLDTCPRCSNYNKDCLC